MQNKNPLNEPISFWVPPNPLITGILIPAFYLFVFYPSFFRIKPAIWYAYGELIATISIIMIQSTHTPVARVSNDGGQTFGPMLRLAANGTISSTEEEEGGGAGGRNSGRRSSGRSSSSKVVAVVTI